MGSAPAVDLTSSSASIPFPRRMPAITVFTIGELPSAGNTPSVFGSLATHAEAEVNVTVQRYVIH